MGVIVLLMISSIGTLPKFTSLNHSQIGRDSRAKARRVRLNKTESAEAKRNAKTSRGAAFCNTLLSSGKDTLQNAAHLSPFSKGTYNILVFFVSCGTIHALVVPRKPWWQALARTCYIGEFEGVPGNVVARIAFFVPPPRSLCRVIWASFPSTLPRWSPLDSVTRSVAITVTFELLRPAMLAIVLRAGPSASEKNHWEDEGIMAERVVIIGSGPAGWTAAIYTARAGLNPLVVEGAITEENRQKGTLPLGQLALTTEVENYPGFPAGDLSTYLQDALEESRIPYRDPKHVTPGVTGPELMEFMRQQAVNFGSSVLTDDVVTVDLTRHPFRLTTLGNETREVLAVIIATGARANYLGLPSEDRFKNQGVSACAVCDGALPRFRNQPLAVVGGGDSAVEEATYLTKFASKVYMIHRRDQLRASKIMAQRALANSKIEVKWNSVVDEILGDDDAGVTGVRLRSTTDKEQTEDLAVSGYFAAIGHTPNTDFLEGQIALTEKGYVVWATPGRTNTSVEGVFAAGDVADDYYRQAITAAASGCMAALDTERWLAAKGFE